MRTDSKIGATLLLAIVLILTGTSCKSNSNNNNPLLGKWEQVYNQDGLTLNASYDFKESGDVKQKVKLKTAQLEIDVEGTAKYNYSGDSITFKFTPEDIKFNKVEAPGLSEEQIEIVKEMALSQLADRASVLSNVKISGKTLTGSYNGEEITMTKE